MELLNPCKYSFKDLLISAGKPHDEHALIELYDLPQEERNRKVMELCKIADWYYTNIISDDGVTYTAFSPELMIKR